MNKLKIITCNNGEYLYLNGQFVKYVTKYSINKKQGEPTEVVIHLDCDEIEVKKEEIDMNLDVQLKH